VIRTIATTLALLWTAPVVTEKVEIGGGPVDLTPFACTDTPRSTMIQRVCYDKASRHLLVGIRGSYRDYCAVPLATFEAFITARSLGYYYRQTFARSDVDGPFTCPRAAVRQNEKGPT
jgi:KTSC domain-containing protein